MKPSATSDALEQRLRDAARTLGIGELSREQRRLARALVERRSVLGVAPDSVGLRAAAHVAALVAERPVVFLSPHAATLREHCERLQVRRLPALDLGADAGPAASRDERLTALSGEGPQLVFASPAALRDEALRGRLRAIGVAAVVIEEAQALSPFSHEFSPALQTLTSHLDDLRPEAICALLPVAAPMVAHDVAERLLLRHALRVESPMLRPNVTLECVIGRGDVRHRALASLAARLRRPGLVLCPTGADVEAVATALAAIRVPVHRYHGGMPPSERTAELLGFVMPGRRAVMVATSGFAPSASPPQGARAAPLVPTEFGRSLDKRDLRFVIHHQSPASLEQLARELDLAGRDGDPATAVLLYDPTDPRRWEQSLADLRPRPSLVTRVASGLAGLAEDGRGVTLDSLALAAGTSRPLAEFHAGLLAEAGHLRLTDGWVESHLPRSALLDRARRLADDLSTFALQDSERQRALVHLGEGRGCRAAAVLRYFGGNSDARCGHCSVCTGSTATLWGDDGAAAPRRRAEARTFSLTPAAGSAPPESAPGDPATATLGDLLSV